MLPRQPKHHQEADLALREFQQGLTVGKVVLDVGDKAAIAKVQRNQISNFGWMGCCFLYRAALKEPSYVV